MKIKNSNLKILFTLSFIFIFTCIYIFVLKDKDNRIDIIQQNQLKKIQMLYKFVMHDFKLAADARVENILNDQKVINILEKAKKLPVKKQEVLRFELYDYLWPMFFRLKSVGLTNLHFVFENNRTFLRMHKLKKYGDDLTNYRYTIKYVNEYRTPIEAYEQGRTKHGFRFVYPIFNRRGYYIGAVDFTFSSEYLQKILSNYLDIHSHFLVDKKILKKKAWEDGDLSYSYKNSIENDDYLIALNHETGNTKHTSIKIPFDIKRKIKKKMDENKDFYIYNIGKDNATIITFLAIKDMKYNKSVAYLVAYTQNRPLYDIVNRYKLILVILFFTLFIVFFFLYNLLTQKDKLREEVKKQILYIEKLHDNYDKNIIASSIDLKGHIIYISEAFCNTLGYTKDELLGKTYDTALHNDVSRRTKRDMYLTISSDKIWKGKLKTKSKDGKILWFDTIIMPIYDYDETKIGYSIIGHNITDKLNLEKLNQTLEDRISKEVENLREKDRQLLEQSRLAQMGEMLSMIAHQWRQPLAAISSASSAIIIKSKLGKLDKEMSLNLAEKIAQYTHHLSSTIDDFREFFKPNKNSKTITYHELVNSVLNIVEESILNKGITLIKDLECTCKLKTYPNEIKQVILNLIKNAEDILLEKKIDNAFIKISTYDKNTKAILKVEDNGGGISEEIMKHIFDPYFSTKTEKDGTGLGLYMSKIIIEEHCKGKLKVFNTQHGAAFEIVLDKVS